MKHVKIYENYKEFLDEENYLFNNRRSIDFEKLGYDYNVNGVTQKFLDKHDITLEEYSNMNESNTRCWNCWMCEDCSHCESCIKCRNCAINTGCD